MSLRYKSLMIYTFKIGLAIFLSYIFHAVVPKVDYAWCLISSVLVLSPEGTDSLTLAITRMKANLVGASCGVALLATPLSNPFNIVLACAVALIVVDQLKLNAGARSTLAAAIIVLLHQEGVHLWDAALGRVLAVIAGCLFALAITYVFHSIFKIDLSAADSDKKTDS